MPDEKNIKKYTAADIEKYHRGLLSPAEKHALEKAALDDPMLADALEGYATAGVNYTKAISDLKQRLAERTGSGKTVVMQSARSAIFNGWKVAAMIILVSGTAFLVYWFAFENNKNNNLAVQPKEKETISPAINDSTEGNTNNLSSALENKTEPDDKSVKQNNETGTGLKSSAAGKTGTTIRSDTAAFSITGNDAVSGINVSPYPQEKENNIPPGYTESKKQQTDIKPETAKAGEAGKDFYKRPEGILSNQSIVITDAKKKTVSPGVNYFRGRVTDESNNPLPFANITNVEDNVGTYSDAKGNFTLISTDSVLKVQVRSLGFENNQVSLRGNVASNKIVLQEDNSMTATVLSNYRPNAERLQQLREANITIEEPEPVDGWENYDTYLVNNRNIPDEKRKSQIQGEVEISFDVDKKGQPINIKVEKSLCSSCDEEAVRLIKEGPKWKIKGKKSRARVAVPFDE
jgi:TonB family protein